MFRLTRRAAIGNAIALAIGQSSAVGLSDAVAAGTAEGSLHAIGATRGIAFGSCIGTGPSGAPRPASADVTRAASFDNPRVREIVLQECGVIVPENELKWYALRPTPQGFAFDRADRLAAFAAQHRLAMRGHTLLWNHMNWIPGWVKEHDFGSTPATAAERMLREHIAVVCGRYNARIDSWDVVNETIHEDTGVMRDTVFTRYLGEKVIDVAFHAAREAAPHAQLVYNDYMGGGEGSSKHRAGVLRLLERLRASGVPIDALGLQSHLATFAPGTGADELSARERNWRQFLDEVTGMGLDLVVTELDARDNHTPADFAVRDRAVADCTRAYLDMVLSYRQTRCVMAWGLVDRYSWLQDRWPRDDGLPKRPCPYDDDYRPKAMRDAIAAALLSATPRAARPA